MIYGSNGRILKINLSTESIKIEEPDEIFYRRYLGGNAMATYYLLKELKGGVEPLAPENVLIFATSVIVGAPIAGASRYTVAAKSPLTYAIGLTEAGGFFGPELKFAGYDVIIISGKASTPVYIWICNGEVEIRKASHLWGQNTGETETQIRKELNDRLIRVACIGIAGEKMVRYACIVNNLKHVNGRTGMGAVMGSKNLKAVAVRGKRKYHFKEPQKVKEMGKWFSNNFMDNPDGRRLHDYGTASATMGLNALGILPTESFKKGSFNDAHNISGKLLNDTILIKNEGCYACPQKCKRVVRVEGERYNVDPIYGGPEYETIAALGSLCNISNLEAIAKANELCNKYSLDTISTGVCISFAMECFKKGLLSVKDTNGFNIRYGNADDMVKLVEMIAKRQGFGDLLADGVKRAADRIGNGASELALHVKGQELPMHEPRGKVSVALMYAISPTGADHLISEHDHSYAQEGFFLDRMKPLGILEPIHTMDFGPQKIRAFVYLQNVKSLYNSLGMCICAADPGPTFTFHKIVEMVEYVTGWNTSLWELLKIGERTTTMTRIFNLREGFTCKDDNLPTRMFEGLENGPLSGNCIKKENLREAIRLYYGMMGWDSETGIPTLAKLHELDLGWAKELLDINK